MEKFKTLKEYIVEINGEIKYKQIKRMQIEEDLNITNPKLLRILRTGGKFEDFIEVYNYVVDYKVEE